jgi:16S rRNA (guanine527-N7)-methyltransferase
MPRSPAATGGPDPAAGGDGRDLRDRARLERLLELVLTAEKRVTAVRIEDAWQRHVLDALQGLEMVDAEPPGDVVDVGSGNGIPGLVLAIERPARQVLLVEANGRKAALLEAVVSELGLPNASVVRARAETLAREEEHRDRHVIAVCRALAPPVVSLEYCLPLVAPRGCLVAWLGAIDRDDLQFAAQRLGGAVDAVWPVPGSERRTLVRVRKTQTTPPSFPRRAGMAAKRPLTRV